MKTLNQSVLNTLIHIELNLRKEIMSLAEQHNYSAIVFSKDDSCVTMGESFRSGLNARWTNVMRLISLLKNNQVDYLFVLRELSRQDLTTLKQVHAEMPS